MNYFFLIIHVASAILFIGGVTVSTSLFPRYATGADAAAFAEKGGHPAAVAMHRITYVYGRLAIITPVAGLLLAVMLGRLMELWVLLSIALVAAGSVLLVVQIIPMQREMLKNPPVDGKARGRAMGYAGMLNVIWLAVLVLMFLKPGASA